MVERRSRRWMAVGTETRTASVATETSSKLAMQGEVGLARVPSEGARNFYEKFAATAERFASRVAIVFQRRSGLDSLTYGELRLKTEAAGGFLLSLGIKPGDACAILADNSIAWCASYLGILRIGAIAVPFDTHYTAQQIGTLLRDSCARILLTTPRYLPAADQAVSGEGLPVKIVLLEGGTGEIPNLEQAWREKFGLRPPCPSTKQDPAVVLYTSGTTSDPKGVVLTHGNLLAEAEAVFGFLQVDERDSILGVLPLFHALAQVGNLLLPFMVGASVIFLEELNTGELLRALREREPTAFCCVPKFFYLIHERVFGEAAKAGWLGSTAFALSLRATGALRRLTGINLGRLLFRRVHGVFGPRMRILITGGARFEPVIGRDFYRLGFGLMEVYGLTETTGAATLTRAGEGGQGSVGRPLPGVEVKLFPAEGIAVGGPQEGEIAIRGPIVMQGYLHRPEATAEAMRDGWLLTGDLGRLDARGRLAVTGRKKEVIVLSSGKNVYPEEVEAHYAQSPYIQELCILGLPAPGETAPERLHAVIVPNQEAMIARKVVNAREVLRFDIENLSLRLPSHQRILSYEVWTESLPRTTTSKLKRYEIERRVLALRRAEEAPAKAAPISEEEAAWESEPRVAQALELVRRSTRQKENVRPDANLELDLGLDSIERVELLANLESLFNVQIASEVASQIYTVRQLVEAVRAHEPEAAAAAGGDAWRKILADLPEQDPLFANLIRTQPLVHLVVFVTLKILRGLAWLLLGFRVSGAEHIPTKGPVLLCPNHQSYLDPFLLASVLPYRTLGDLCFLGASEYFATPLRAALARWLHIAPVDPDTNLVRAMQAGAFGLKHGKILVLFPEGERSIDGEVKKFKKGAAILSTQLQVPVIPVAVQGTFDVWPRGRGIRWSALVPWKGARVHVRFGAAVPVPPAPAPDVALADMEARYAAFAEHVRESVLELGR
jgi:long-chain acyl-CoA synthetase